MAGEQLERVIGTQLSHFVPDLPEQLAGDLSGLGRLETRLIGSERSVTVLAAAFPFEIDEVRGHAVTFTDLTEQKSREAALTRATVELEGFCHSVSHDLRAPLRAMIGNAQIVIEDFGHLLPGEAAKDLLQITKSANYLGRLMDDLLNHSRLAGQEIVGQTVDMSALAHEIAQQLGARQYPNVTWDIQPGLIACGDARFLNMAIYNLMANGAKFSARSDDAQIKFGQDPESGAFFVQDNGIGFDMQYASKLFVPFERLHRQADFDGTGIGLANVKRIVGLHGGEVWAQSRPGEGTTFYFTLP
jgi:light-regulated signal transduction histidine kinase (bacteriophytochrome)